MLPTHAMPTCTAEDVVTYLESYWALAHVGRASPDGRPAPSTAQQHLSHLSTAFLALDRHGAFSPSPLTLAQPHEPTRMIVQHLRLQAAGQRTFIPPRQVIDGADGAPHLTSQGLHVCISTPTNPRRSACFSCMPLTV